MKTIILILGLIVSNAIFGQGYLNLKIKKDSALVDFNIFKASLISGHPGIYWNNDKNSILKSFDIAEKKIDKDISVLEFHNILTSVMNEISCGHSIVLLPKEYRENIDTLQIYLPFKFALIDKQLFITKNLSKSDIEIGSKIISINNREVCDLLNILERKIPADRNIESKKTRSLNFMFQYYYSLFIENVNSFDIVLENSEGKMVKKTVNAIFWDNKAMYHSPREIASSKPPLTYKTENNFAELNISTFGNRNFKRNKINFEDTISNIFKDLKEKNIDNLIIDLRDNNGGSLMFSEILISYLTKNNIKFYKSNLMNKDIAEGNFKYADLPHFLKMFEEDLGPLKLDNGQYIIPRDSISASKPFFNGNVFFITNGLTFSATSNFVAVCQENNIGKVIGETPGGAYIGCNGGGPINITLPNSKFGLFFYIIGIRLSVNENQKEIKVDYPIQESIDSVIKNNDKAKSYIINSLIN